MPWMGPLPGSIRPGLRIDNGGLSTCTPGFAFSLISWLSISQSGHTIYQIKAEHLS